jgi:methylglutaconyl-CoA hydratase
VTTDSHDSAAGQGRVSSEVLDGMATITFSHPKGNSLPGALLRQMAAEVTSIGAREDVTVVVLQSAGTGPFCAGASFDELRTIADGEGGKEFFMGFARLILAMRGCPRPVIARVHGKAVGGGVGVAAAADYAIATRSAALRLSELAVGIGPFVVGPAIERKIGAGAFGALAIDADWRDAEWGERHGLYARLVDDVAALDEAVIALARRLASFSPEALATIKRVTWEGTDHWERLLPERAEMSGTLVLSEFTRNAIAAFSAK